MNKPVHIVSFSGGKDSTAMLLMMLERGMTVDDIIFCDTGMEFPQMYEHIEAVKKYIGREITVLKSDKSFEWFMLEKDVKKKNGEEYHGLSFPGIHERWCTTHLKVQVINKYLKKYKDQPIKQYVGIAWDELNRCKDKCYPLVNWKITEAQALQYCYEKGFDWGGLYKYFRRVSCWCCPLQGINEARNLRKHFPELWQKILVWEKQTWRSFKAGYTAEQLEERFAKEDKWEAMQIKLF